MLDRRPVRPPGEFGRSHVADRGGQQLDTPRPLEARGADGRDEAGDVEVPVPGQSPVTHRTARAGLGTSRAVTHLGGDHGAGREPADRGRADAEVDDVPQIEGEAAVGGAGALHHRPGGLEAARRRVAVHELVGDGRPVLGGLSAEFGEPLGQQPDGHPSPGEVADLHVPGTEHPGGIQERPAALVGAPALIGAGVEEPVPQELELDVRPSRRRRGSCAVHAGRAPRECGAGRHATARGRGSRHSPPPLPGPPRRTDSTRARYATPPGRRGSSTRRAGRPRRRAREPTRSRARPVRRPPVTLTARPPRPRPPPADRYDPGAAGSGRTTSCPRRPPRTPAPGSTRGASARSWRRLPP